MRDIKTIVVLDDDPTGTQTVHGIPVITSWAKEVIEAEFNLNTPLFYILTNSRALLEEDAAKLGLHIGQTLKEIGKPVFVISRGDSTLRGHFPKEVAALAKGLGWSDNYLIVLAPAFFEGNRLTKGDVHYIKENEQWIPVAETPYAKDKTFGYKNSNLKEWVIEKTNGQIGIDEIGSISLKELESDNIESILQKIEVTPKVLIVNATKPEHLITFATIVKTSNRNIIFRTAASIVPALGGIEPKPLLNNKSFESSGYNKQGGLIIVGSHVPKSTTQLKELLKTGIASVEFDVEQYLKKTEAYLNDLSVEINSVLDKGTDLVLYTSRKLVSKNDLNESLLLSIKVSEGLIYLVKKLEKKPAFLIAKGGITSSDVATKGLNIKRAIVLGQILPGVPVWQADESSRFPDLHYVVFPGNVGTDDGLLQAYKKINPKP
ncbi:MAG: hypothetical protein NXI00_15300 [Cytophagales bacterium]|nr:hypothetical protein [Cytophagales bacterium]